MCLTSISNANIKKIMSTKYNDIIICYLYTISISKHYHIQSSNEITKYGMMHTFAKKVNVKKHLLKLVDCTNKIINMIY